MVSIRFSRLVLGLLLAFAILSRDSLALAHTHQEVETMGKRNGLGAFGVEPTSGNQGRLRDAIAMGSKNTWPKGRKMLVMENIKDEEVKRDASKITGKGNYASEEKSYGRPGTNMNDEIKKKMLNPKSLNQVEMGSIGSSHGPKDQAETQLLKPQLSEASSTQGNLESSSNSKAPVSQEPLYETPETTESKKLREASMNTMNMLSMDYSHTPRHRPPINNGQPLSGKVTKP